MPERFTLSFGNIQSGAVDGDNTSLGGKNEPEIEPQLGTTGQRKRRGPKRGRPRSVGRYPFLTRLAAFLEEIRPYYALVSHGNMARKLTQLHRMLQELKKDDPSIIQHCREHGFLPIISGSADERHLGDP